jgi:monoterpene epsilon-lactone hydrolase
VTPCATAESERSSERGRPRLSSQYRSEDPLVAPINSPEIIAKFPPTLIIPTTRGFEKSGAHTQVKLGVYAELHVWGGLFHGFFYNPDVPESRDCYDVMIRFFDRHLGKHR